MPQYMRHRPVDLRIALTTLFVGDVPCIAYPGQDKPMFNARHHLLILSQPCNRSNCPGNERESGMNIVLGM